MEMNLSVISTIVSVLMIILGGCCIARKRIKAGVVTGTVGVLVLLVFLAYNLFFYYNEEQVGVYTSTEEEQELFALDIESRILKNENVYTRFVTSLSMADMAEVVENTYANDAVAQEQDGIKITRNNKVITIKQEDTENFLWIKRYVYVMETECISFAISDEKYVCIPFPDEYIAGEGAYETVMDITCGMDELKEFYEDCSNVDINGSTIVITQEEQIELTVEEGKLTIQVRE